MLLVSPVPAPTTRHSRCKCPKKSPPSAEAEVDEVQNMDLAPNTKPQRGDLSTLLFSCPPSTRMDFWQAA